MKLRKFSNPVDPILLNNLRGLGVFGKLNIGEIRVNPHITGCITRNYRYTPRSYRANVIIFIHNELAVTVKVRNQKLTCFKGKGFYKLQGELKDAHQSQRYVRKSSLFR